MPERQDVEKTSHRNHYAKSASLSMTRGQVAKFTTYRIISPTQCLIYNFVVEAATELGEVTI